MRGNHHTDLCGCIPKLAQFRDFLLVSVSFLCHVLLAADLERISTDRDIRVTHPRGRNSKNVHVQPGHLERYCSNKNSGHYDGGSADFGTTRNAMKRNEARVELAMRDGRHSMSRRLRFKIQICFSGARIYRYFGSCLTLDGSTTFSIALIALHTHNAVPACC